MSETIFLTDFNEYNDNEIVITKRIGIKVAADLPLRFYVNNPETLKFISKK